MFKTKIWAAPGLQSDLAEAIKSVLLNQAPPAARRAGNLLLSRGLAVLRAELEFTIMGTHVNSSGEYVKSEPQSIDDAVFKIPSDLSMVPLTESMEPQDE